MITLVTPNFNGATWLGECLDSVASQTLDQRLIEMIIVDDGSTDESVRVMQSYARRIPGLKIIQRAHVGMPGALRNVAIGQAAGEYVLFLDSDDFLGVESLARLHAFVDQAPADVVAFQLEGFERNVARSMLRQTIQNADLVTSGIYKTLGTWKMYRRQFLTQNNIMFPTELGRGEDIIFSVEAMLRAEVVSILSGYPFYTVRGRSDGSSITQRPWQHSARIAVAHRMAEAISRLAPTDIIANHFMIRAFDTDAITVLSDSNTTDGDRKQLKEALGQFWSADIGRLIPTNENLVILKRFFGDLS